MHQGENSPQFIYYKTLFHVFEKFLIDQHSGGLLDERTNFYDTKVWNALFDFQKDGVKGAINKILTHNGCIIADSVGLGKAHGGKVMYRDDWTKFTLAELWDSAKEAMNCINNAAAAPLIADIETHRLVFLDDWSYDSVSRLDKPSLDAAWATLRDLAAGPIKTRLITFR